MRPKMTTLEWLSSHLPRLAQFRLKCEYLHFFNEEAVIRQFNCKRDFHGLMVNEVLRECFPFALSRFGYDYWSEVAESLPYGIVGESIKRQARRERARERQTNQ